MIAFALHFFSVRIFPICPIDLGIIINVFAQDDNRELHGVPLSWSQLYIERPRIRELSHLLVSGYG